MGGKKKKGGKGKKGDDDEMNIGTLNAILEAQVQSMQQKIVLEQERLTNALGAQDYLRSKEVDLDGKMEDLKTATKFKIGEMTIMYRRME